MPSKNYNPTIHHRKSIRLKGYDYSQAALYFVTICCDSRKCHFGTIENNEIVLSEYGQVAYNEWIKLSERFMNFNLDVFQIMPNHIHGIILLTDIERTGLSVVQNDNYSVDNRAGASPAPTIGDIVGSYKSLVANHCLKIHKTTYVGAGFTPAQIPSMGKLWQRDYFEHIIRNEQSYQTISDYIISNPAQWLEDKFYIQQ